MDLEDAAMVQALLTRDGPMGGRRFSHRARAGCRYADLYLDPESPCPWCVAEDRRAAEDQRAAEDLRPAQGQGTPRQFQESPEASDQLR